MERKRTAARIPIVVLGEKDHGKSTLLGRLLYETGGLPKDRLREVRNATRTSGKRFEWAHILDAFRYEREHEMTLDTSRIIVGIDRCLYECIDVPGHRELIKNMLSGTSEAHYAILVVAATSGVTPQTILHLEIAKFLGIKELVAVINKCDFIGYSRERFERRKREAAAALARAGFGNAPILPLNAATGDNMLARTPRLRWFHGPTMLQAIKKSFKPIGAKSKKMPFLMPVQDIYSGPVIVGQVMRGKVKLGQRVRLLPKGVSYAVREITSGNAPKTAAFPGDNIGVALDPKPLDIKRGDILTTGHVPFVRNLSAHCIFIKKPKAKKMMLESGFQKSAVRIKSDTKEFTAGKTVKISAQLEEQSAILEKFVLKENGEIIGLGRIA